MLVDKESTDDAIFMATSEFISHDPILITIYTKLNLSLIFFPNHVKRWQNRALYASHYDLQSTNTTFCILSSEQCQIMV